MKYLKLIVVAAIVITLVLFRDQIRCGVALNQLSVANTHSLLGGSSSSTNTVQINDETTSWFVQSCPAPVTAHLYFQQGLTLEATGQELPAVDSFHKARDLDANLRLAYLKEGNALANTGAVEEAVAVWQQGELGHVFRIRGKDAIDGRDLSAAETNLKLALQVVPSDADAHTLLGTVYRLQNRWELAAESYEKAIALNAEDFDATYHLGRVLLNLNRLAEARTSAEKAIALDPQYIWSYILAGDAYRLEKNFAAAKKWYEEAGKLPAGGDLARKYVSITDIAAGDGAAAIAALAAISPTSTDMTLSERHALTGMAYAADEQYEAGLVELEAAVQLEPGNISYKFELAKIFRALGQIEGAKALYESVLVVDPDNAAALTALEQLGSTD
jgi:tetratricopeptide (TPR) repeat protein